MGGILKIHLPIIFDEIPFFLLLDYIFPCFKFITHKIKNLAEIVI